MTERNPWSMVIGSDVPTFYLYETGQIIYKNLENEDLKIHEIQLTEQELRKVIQSLSISSDIYNLPNDITVANQTDQPTAELVLDIKTRKTISVYGDLDSDSEVRKRIPSVFLGVYDNIKKYKNDLAKDWFPDKIEIMFWDYDYAPNKKLWPKKFPDLRSTSTIKRGDMYSLYIDKTDFDEFKEYYSSLGEKEAVEINGKKMAISYRFPFPNIK